MVTQTNPLSADHVSSVHNMLLDWFSTSGRDLPWRTTRDPYRVLVAEMMLQQTGVDRVKQKYDAWLQQFRSLNILASAETSMVIRAWSGLGYNNRAVRLQHIARTIVNQFNGHFPQTYADLVALKGIGPYTAGAILCFAFEQDVAFIDTNIRRVLSRVFIGPENIHPPLSDKAMLALTKSVIPTGRAWPWYQALMDLGATICLDAAPRCLICPLRDSCLGAAQSGRVARESRTGYSAKKSTGAWLGSRRYYRGQIVATLTSLAPGIHLSFDQLTSSLTTPDIVLQSEDIMSIMQQLERDGLVQIHTDSTLSLPT